MLQFLHGSRQIMGWAALATACILMIGWVRSSFLIDSIYFPSGKKSFACLWSSQSSICLWAAKLDDDNQVEEVFSELPLFDSHHFSENDFRHTIENPLFAMDHEWCGFGFAVSGDGLTKYVVPYWSVVIPLTMLSANLITSGARNAKSAATTEC